MAKTEKKAALDAEVHGDDLHLMYKIEGRPHEVDIFDL
jgi:hypothetical protein